MIEGLHQDINNPQKPNSLLYFILNPQLVEAVLTHEQNRTIARSPVKYEAFINRIPYPGLRDSLQAKFEVDEFQSTIIFDAAAKWTDQEIFCKYIRERLAEYVDQDYLSDKTQIAILALDGSVFTATDENNIAIPTVHEIKIENADKNVQATALVGVADHHGNEVSRLNSPISSEQAPALIAGLKEYLYFVLNFITIYYTNDFDPDVVLTLAVKILDDLESVLNANDKNIYGDLFRCAKIRLARLIKADSEKDRHVGIFDPKKIYGEHWRLEVKLCEYLFQAINKIRLLENSTPLDHIKAMDKTLERIFDYLFDLKKGVDSMLKPDPESGIQAWVDEVMSMEFNPKLEVLAHFSKDLSITILKEVHPSDRMCIPETLADYLNQPDFELDPNTQIYIFPRVDKKGKTSYTIYGPTLAVNSLVEFLNVAELWFEQLFGTPKAYKDEFTPWIDPDQNLLSQCLKYVYTNPSGCLFTSIYKKDEIGHTASHRKPSRFLDFEFLNIISEWFVQNSSLFSKSSNPKLYTANSNISNELAKKLAYRSLYTLLKNYSNKLILKQPSLSTNIKYRMYVNTTSVSHKRASESSSMNYSFRSEEERRSLIQAKIRRV